MNINQNSKADRPRQPFSLRFSAYPDALDRLFGSAQLPPDEQVVGIINEVSFAVVYEARQSGIGWKV